MRRQAIEAMKDHRRADLIRAAWLVVLAAFPAAGLAVDVGPDPVPHFPNKSPSPSSRSDAKTLPVVTVYATGPSRISIGSQSFSLVSAPRGGGSEHTSINRQPTSDRHYSPNTCVESQGDPVMTATGAKVESHTLFALPGEMGLSFSLNYRSVTVDNGTARPQVSHVGQWASNLDFHLDHTRCASLGGDVEPCADPLLLRPDGSQIYFKPQQPLSTPRPPGAVLQQTGPFLASDTGTATLRYAQGGYTLTDEDGRVLGFDAFGNLQQLRNASGVGWTIGHSAGWADWSGAATLPYTTTVTHSSGQSYTITINPADAHGQRRVVVTDPAGHPYQYEVTGYTALGNVSGMGRIESETYPGEPGLTVSYHYAPATRLQSNALIATDYNGVPHDVTAYDAAGHVSLTRMADGTEATSFAYAVNDAGRTVTVTNALGHVSVYQYDPAGLMQSVTGQASAQCAATYAAFSYDAHGFMTSATDNNGHLTRYNYQPNGQLQQKTEAADTELSRVTDYVWDPKPGSNRLLHRTVQGLARTDYSYDAHDRLASVTNTDLSGTGSLPPQTRTFAYDLAGNGMISSMVVTEPSPDRSDATLYQYTPQGFLRRVADALDHVTAYADHTPLGQPQTVTLANGQQTHYRYDARSRLTETSYQDGGAVVAERYGYDANASLLASILRPDGESIEYAYDPDFKRTGAIWRGVGGEVITRTYAYDALADPVETVLRRQGQASPDLTTHTRYDELGRPVEISGNHGQRRRMSYDLNGQLSAVVDAQARTTQYAYDALNRLSRLTDPVGHATSYRYNAADQLVQLVDPRGLVTDYGYDGLGLLWNLHSPDSGDTRYRHDAYGRLSEMTRADGQSIEYAYDVTGRLISAVAGDQARTYIYDSCEHGTAQLCQLVDASGTTRFGYAGRGRLNRRDWSHETQGTSHLAYSYDGMGRLSKIDEDQGQFVINYRYMDDQVAAIAIDADGQTLKVLDDARYNASRQVLGWTYGSGIVRSLTYDDDGRLLGLESSRDGQRVQGLRYDLDTLDHIVGIDNQTYADASQRYAYDLLGRLVAVTGAAPLSLEYDPNGNRIRQSDTADQAIVIDAKSNRLLARGRQSYGYNAHGDTDSILQGDSQLQARYDGFGDLISVQRSKDAQVCEANGACRTYTAGETRYGVDALGLRHWSQGPDRTTGYAYGLDRELLEQTTLEAGSDRQHRQRYVYFNGLPVALYSDGALYELHDDHLGRPELATNPSGVMVWRAVNDAFDRRIVLAGLPSLDLGLPGQIFDANTGLWGNGFRDYLASDGRYLQTDPIGLAGGVNTYAYAGGDPISLVDPLGLDALVCTYPGSGINVWGHIGIGVGPNPTSTFGYYPKKSGSKAITGTSGVVKQDTGSAEACKTFKTLPEQDRVMQSVIDRRKAVSGDYSFTGNNCVSFVRSVLQSIGMKTSDSIRPHAFMDGLEGGRP